MLFEDWQLVRDGLDRFHSAVASGDPNAVGSFQEWSRHNNLTDALGSAVQVGKLMQSYHATDSLRLLLRETAYEPFLRRILHDPIHEIVFSKLSDSTVVDCVTANVYSVCVFGTSRVFPSYGCGLLLGRNRLENRYLVETAQVHAILVSRCLPRVLKFAADPDLHSVLVSSLAEDYWAAESRGYEHFSHVVYEGNEFNFRYRDGETVENY